MSTEFKESSNVPPENASSSSSSSGSNDTGNFECNICFDLAQDPIVTLCGHLYCWPCLYKWLHIHSHCQECPVCKALVQEEKLVPLYGRGKTPSDPRKKSVPGVDIPNRPAGQRPQTAAPPNVENFPQHGFGSTHGFGFMNGFAPMPGLRIGNFTISAGFGGLFSLFPSLFNLHVHGFHNPPVYREAPTAPFGFHGGHTGHTHRFNPPSNQGQQADSNLKLLFMMIGFFVLFALLIL